MCNAWNHSPGCTCGFGGDGHLGVGGGGVTNSEIYLQIYESFALRQLEIDKTRYDSYVNPNAICPVCGATVYFYQSPDGGRVFFDDLGPPWPKHPCTDGDRIPELNDQKNANEPGWGHQGWIPLHIISLEAFEGKYIVKGYLLKKTKIRHLENCLLEEFLDVGEIDFAFYRELDNDNFEVTSIRLATDTIETRTGYRY